jgi:glycosyltransferase involved in cell wall biosynthesis
MDDVCIIVESVDTPNAVELPHYVIDLITALKELQFGVIFVTQKPMASDAVITNYPLNLNTLINVCVDNAIVYKSATPQKKKFYDIWKTINHYYRAPLNEKKNYLEQMIDGLAINEKRVLSTKDILFSKQMWNLITEDYQKKDLHIPFVNYYKIFYHTQGSLFQLMNINIPQAKVYHVFSSLYTLWIALIAKRKYCASLILEERDTDSIAGFMDITSHYVSQHNVLLLSLDPQSLAVLHELYKETCDAVKYLGYSYTDILVTQYGGQQRDENQMYQDLIPHTVQIQEGIKLKEDEKKEKTGSQKKKRFSVGLVGRFIPEDDIKTFIRACHIIAAELDCAEFKIFALAQTDEAYLLECINLRNNLDLALRLEIITEFEEEELWQDIDVFVSTALNNKYSFFILKAMNSGFPLVATSRSVHTELIHGDGRDDSNLGECGFITDIGNPLQIARAVMEILEDKRLKKSMGKVGKKRTEMYYSKEANLKKYLKIYNDYV